jgi:hypothetical protein
MKITIGKNCASKLSKHQSKVHTNTNRDEIGKKLEKVRKVEKLFFFSYETFM